MEHYLIATTMLVVGLFTVLSWDATFPDRRDVMVLSPLPVAPHTILFAKVSASATVLGIAILTLNCGSGVVVPFLVGVMHGSMWGFYQCLAAYWIAIIGRKRLSLLLLSSPFRDSLRSCCRAACSFVFLPFCSLRPSVFFSRLFSATIVHQSKRVGRCSKPMDIGVFALLLVFRPTQSVERDVAAAISWLAVRAWIGLAVAICGAAASLLLCYMPHHEKDNRRARPGAGCARLALDAALRSSLQTAIALFSIRSLTRSRQHRVAFAFYLAFVFGIALSCCASELSSAPRSEVTVDLLMSTFMMMTFAVFGLRSVFALPISLTANWVLRTTQVRSPQAYIAATRGSLAAVCG
jgi:hypothetical protein